MLQDEVNKLKDELRRKEERLYNEQRECIHSWGETKYDPETKTEYVYSHLEGQGSDPYPVYNTYPKEVARWSRACKKCGKTEYTKEQKAVKYEPDFK